LVWIELRPEGVASIRAWPADHGFNCDHRRSYDASSAALAWTRTIEFLKKHVG
jgi:carboxymethylenebutenolidase